MIKITFEIQDEKYYYSYEMGENRGSGNAPLTPDTFVMVANLFHTCWKVMDSKHKKTQDEWTSKAWIENNLDQAKKLIESLEGK